MISELKKLYPEGSVGPGEGIYQGECASFCHALAEFGRVGNSYREKKAYVNANGIIMANVAEIGRGFRVGDVLITSEGTTLGFGNGHVCFLLDPSKMTVAESNFKKDGRVHYGRVVPLNKIYGIIRAPLKIDLGQVEINYNVFINNQKWNLKFLDELSERFLRYTDGKLKINFFPLHTKFKNWWYETQIFPLTGQEVQIIAKGYMQEEVEPFAFTSDNKKSDVYALMIKPSEWQGTITGGQELAYCSPDTKPCQIQASCGEFDVSPFYYGYRLHDHILIHELSHRLHWINGLNDTTHITDNEKRDLDNIFKDLDWNRVKANL